MLLPVLAVLIALATGIDRTWDGNLAQLALQRSAEVAVTRSHRAMPELAGYNWGEVIAWNNAADPAAYALNQWQGSPPHWAILTGTQYRHIACAETVADFHYVVCLFTDRAYVPGIIGPPIVETIPNTAMEEPHLMLRFLLGLLLGATGAWVWLRQGSRSKAQPARFDYRDPATWAVTQNSRTGTYTISPWFSD